MTSPAVDILMATCYGERFVGEQVASLQLQTFRDWRLLVSDDRSADGTPGALRRLAAADPRVRVVAEGERRGGAKRNFMSLLARAEAPYAMFCDQDDVWLPGKVEATLAEMRRLEAEHGAGAPLLAFSDMAVVDEGLGLIAPSFERYSHYDATRTGFAHLLAHNVAAGCTMMLNKALVDLCLRDADTDAIAMHDWWVMLVASAFGAIGHVGAPLSLYRQHGGNQIGARGFSPWRSAANLDFMEEQFRVSLAQAVEFRRVFGSELDDGKARQLDDFVAIGNANSLMGGVLRLAASGSWKRGVRKFGQVVVVMRMAQRSRRSSEES